MKIQLKVILDELRKASPDVRTYMNSKTGEIRREYSSDFEEGKNAFHLPAEQDGTWILLPGQLEMDIYHAMQTFALQRKNPEQKEMLLKVLNNQDVYLQFEQALQKLDLQQAYEKFLEKRRYQIAVSFCKRYNLDFEEEKKIVKATARNVDLLVSLRAYQLKKQNQKITPQLLKEIHAFFERMLAKPMFVCLLGYEGDHVCCCATLIMHEYIPSAFRPKGRAGYISGLYIKRRRDAGFLRKLITKLEKNALYYGCSTVALEISPGIEEVVSSLGYIQDEEWMIKKLA